MLNRVVHGACSEPSLRRSVVLAVCFHRLVPGADVLIIACNRATVDITACMKVEVESCQACTFCVWTVCVCSLGWFASWGSSGLGLYWSASHGVGSWAGSTEAVVLIDGSPLILCCVSKFEFWSSVPQFEYMISVGARSSARCTPSVGGSAIKMWLANGCKVTLNTAGLDASSTMGSIFRPVKGGQLPRSKGRWLPQAYGSPRHQTCAPTVG